MTHSTLSRRTLLASSTLLAAGFGLGARPSVAQSTPDLDIGDIAKYIPEESDFPFEITRTKQEWRDYIEDDPLGDDELAYYVLRQGGTERPKTTDLWKEAHDGGYICRGCDLPLYEGRWFQPLNKGWVFFHHANTHAVLFALDGPVPEYGQAGMLDEDNAIAEIHCRRCGSHVGHHLKVSGMYLHCINGSALKLV